MSSGTAISKGKAPASANWLVLQKQLSGGKSSKRGSTRPKKRRKLNEQSDATTSATGSISLTSTNPVASTSKLVANKNGEEVSLLQQMALGNIVCTPAQQAPGKYLAIDCEMVGIGLNGSESSLARASLVNFYGHVVLDVYVKQRERVVDYRTQWSGIRESDMVNAQPFEEVQKQVADLLKDRILIGHAVHNDLKALLLSHPWPHTRDTQVYAHKFELTKSKRIALRNLVKDELGLTIQTGEHSSVADARATMAIYRLHKKQWEKGTQQHPHNKASTGVKRKTPAPEDGDELSEEDVPSTSTAAPTPEITSPAKKQKKPHASFPGGGRKGLSSGLSTIVRRGPRTQDATNGRDHSTTAASSSSKSSSSEWWKQLPNSTASKGSIQVKMGR